MTRGDNIVDFPSRPRTIPENGAPGGGGGSGSGNDQSGDDDRLRALEREVDRIPGEIRTMSAQINGRIDVILARLGNVATREWVMSRALAIIGTLLGLLVGALLRFVLVNPLSLPVPPPPPFP